jgi:hypothetical protein
MASKRGWRLVGPPAEIAKSHGCRNKLAARIEGLAHV